MPGSLTSAISEPEIFEQAAERGGLRWPADCRGGPFRARLTRIALNRLRFGSCRRAAREDRLYRHARRYGVLLCCRLTKESFPLGAVSRLDGRDYRVWPGRTAARSNGRSPQLGHDPSTGRGAHAIWPGDERNRVSGSRQPRAGDPRRDAEAIVPAPSGRDPNGRKPVRGAGGHRDCARAGAATDARPDRMYHEGPAPEETAAARRHRGFLAGLEELLHAEPRRSIGEICATLGVSDRFLRTAARNTCTSARAVTFASAECRKRTAPCE